MKKLLITAFFIALVFLSAAMAAPISGMLTDAQLIRAIPMMRTYLEEYVEITESAGSAMDQIRADAEKRRARGNDFEGAVEEADAIEAKTLTKRKPRLSDEQLTEMMAVASLLKTAREQADVVLTPEMQEQRENLPPELVAFFKETDNNKTLYLKHKAEVDPLLDQLGELKR